MCPPAKQFILSSANAIVNALCDKIRSMDPAQIPRADRILVVGPTGSGKSTVAHRIHRDRELPLVSLDALHWGPNWTIRPEFEIEVAGWIARDAWIIDGSYRIAVIRAWPRADLVIWVDLPFAQVLSQLVARTFRRCLHKEELFNGNRESLRTQFLSKDSVILWLFKTYRVRRSEYDALASQNPQVPLIRIENRRQFEAWFRR